MPSSIEKYLHQLLSNGAFAAVEISPAAIETAPWVMMKCRYGCPRYGHNRSCPPFSPKWDETAVILASYRRAIIFGVHDMGAGTPLALKVSRMMANDGYYKVIAFGTGPCTRCKECTPERCPSPSEVLPSPESCGIDLIATVRKAGLTIDIPPKEGAPLSCYAIILVD